MSQDANAALPPVPWISSQTDLSGSGRRPTRKRRAPRLAKCTAMERPRPVPPPVRKTPFDFSRSDWNKSGPQAFQGVKNLSLKSVKLPDFTSLFAPHGVALLAAPSLG